MKYAPESLIVLMLTFGVVMFLLALVVKSLMYESGLSDNHAKILTSLLASFVSVISMYIGFKLNNKKE